MYRYSDKFKPPAPALNLSLIVPGSGEKATIESLVDSGADITVLPTEVVSRLRLRRVDLILVSGLEKGASEGLSMMWR